MTHHLQPDLCNLERVRHDDLTTSSGTTGKDLHVQRDVSRLRIRRLFPHQVVDGQLDGFFWCDSNKLGHDSSVESSYPALVGVHLLDAVPSVPVQHLSDNL